MSFNVSSHDDTQSSYHPHPSEVKTFLAAGALEALTNPPSDLNTFFRNLPVLKCCHVSPRDSHSQSFLKMGLGLSC